MLKQIKQTQGKRLRKPRAKLQLIPAHTLHKSYCKNTRITFQLEFPRLETGIDGMNGTSAQRVKSSPAEVHDGSVGSGDS